MVRFLRLVVKFRAKVRNFSVFRFRFSVFISIFAPANVEGFGLIATTIKKC